jgi:integrase
VVYDASVMVTDPVTGKKDRPTKRGLASETEAVEWVQTQRASRLRRVKGMTLNDLAAIFWGSGSVEISTVPSWERMYETDIKPYLGGIPITDLLPMHIDVWVGKIREKPSLRTGAIRKPNSLVNYLTVLSSLLEYAVLNRFIDANWTKSSPAAMRLRKDATNYEPEEKSPWTVENFMDFLKVEDEPSFKSMWCLMAATGVRRGHACGVRWEEVEWERSRIVFGTNRVYSAGQVKTTIAKGGRRIILPMDDALADILRAQKKRQEEEGIQCSPGPDGVSSLCPTKDPHPCCYVFDRPVIHKTWNGKPVPKGQPMDPSGVTARFKRLVKRAKLPSGSPHTLRHTWATLARDAGATREAVADVLGHGSSIVTRTYDHSDKQGRELAGSMAKLVLGE